MIPQAWPLLTLPKASSGFLLSQPTGGTGRGDEARSGCFSSVPLALWPVLVDQSILAAAPAGQILNRLSLSLSGPGVVPLSLSTLDPAHTGLSSAMSLLFVPTES